MAWDAPTQKEVRLRRSNPQSSGSQPSRSAYLKCVRHRAPLEVGVKDVSVDPSAMGDLRPELIGRSCEDAARLERSTDVTVGRRGVDEYARALGERRSAPA
jgi:hypothetical protein